jgi:hypothetical protein
VSTTSCQYHKQTKRYFEFSQTSTSVSITL